ncbi:MAG: FixH family protein [Acidobacteriota bacterium]
MKFHWGIGISLLYGLFVVGIFIIVLFYMGQDVDLVTKEYYNDEIKYQDKIEKLKRTRALKDEVKFTPADEKVRISFPGTIKENISGEILFFRPSDKKYDFRLMLKPGPDLVQSVDFHGRRKGLWKIEMNWKAGSAEYLNEEIINVR